TVVGEIEGTTITLLLPEETVLNSLEPMIEHTGESISPLSDVAQDFTNPVNYTVTAQDGTEEVFTVTVTREVAVTSVEITPETGTIAINATQQCVATIGPTNATNQTIIWTSSDPNIGSITPEGLLTGVAEGVVTITATASNGVESTSVMTVTAASSTKDITAFSINGVNGVISGTAVTVSLPTG
ncbi:Ig-like domain-containing protein, partial [uncultured Maribacter sp.]|uniref:Ig-like domain-containing protein n=1 Tax=uncultured Maribacter sp. TaxID=431308 RepID=UPI00261482E6